MESDSKDRIFRDFGAAANGAYELVSSFEQEAHPGPRITRCVVHLAGGDIAKLKKAISDATADWRDVILWAEGTAFDFNKPFQQK